MANHGAASETNYTYDVFLSFRGEDTRHTFTCHLYHALHRKGINTFMDDEEMKLGDQLGHRLLEAIEESRISIVVFSENYADSSWCLDELVEIHECMKSKNQLVWPIFYKVDPSDVRYQNGSYGKAMTKHETRYGKDSEKVQKWRSALKDIANLKREHLKVEQGMDESKFIDDLARQIFIKVSPKDLSSNEHIVGREYRVEELKSRLKLESHNITCWLGIHGTSGIGKTTLAKALYDSIYKQFQGSCFLPNVRETSNKTQGMKDLQEQLLSEILEDKKIQLNSIEEGIGTIESRLRLKRVLLVLDDVDDIEQLKMLAQKRDWFGPGSTIIITTRDTHLLDVGEVEKRYEVKVLNDQESLELFCHSAFRKSCPEINYEDLTNRAMRCCKGLPLALRVLGSHMVGKDLGGWKDALDRYEKSPHPDVQKVLRISYDCLPFNEKIIFLDIACFFKGRKLEYVKEVLDACGFSSGDGITTLINKSLLIVDNHRLGMHDLIQDMGREIVKEEAGNKVGERSRLWHHEDVLQVLADNNGSSEIQGIMLRPPQREEINCTDTVFEKMKNLRILIVDNTSFSREPRYLPNNLRVLEWMDYPSQSFPLGFYPRKIVSFNLSDSPLLVLEKPFQLDGRVKTLHPNIHGGILARRDQKHHIEALSTHGIATSPPQTVGLRSNTATTTAFETRFGPSDDLRNFRRVRKEIKKLEVKMPRIRDIPEWFDYVKEGGFPVFKARGKFPAVALAIVFGKVETRDFESIGHVCMDLFIEDEHRGNLNDLVKKNHVLLCDLRCFFHLKEWEDVGNDWKTIKVYCETKLPLRSWGIYVYKHETNIEDIQFLSQHPTSSLVRSLHALSEVGEAWF